MKRIGVISDTHLKGPDKAFNEIIEKYFQDVDMIVHAGDMVTLSVLEPLFILEKKIVAVCGNMDYPDVQRAYPLRRTIQVEEVRLGIIHGWGSPNGIRSRIRNSFEKVDSIIYGHIHQAFSASEAGVFFFNPGSVTDSRFTTPCSLGIMTIDRHMIQGEIIPL